MEIQRANLNAKRQMDILKEKEYFWGAGYTTIILFSILIREWLPVNLLIMFLLINIAIMVLKMWMKEKFQE